MGTARNIRGWSVVQDRACICGRAACAEKLEEQRARREAIIAAQELVFDDPSRMTGLEYPILPPDLTAARCAG